MSTMIITGELPVTGTIQDSYVTFNHIPIMNRVAVWPGHLFRGTVTGWVGDGGTGKGLTGIHAGAALVTGGLMPGEPAGTTRDRSPKRVLGVWPEDDANEDLAGRWDTAIRMQLAAIALGVPVYELPGLDREQVNAALGAIAQDRVDTALSLVTNMTESLDDDPFTLGKATESLAAMRAMIDSYADSDAPVELAILDPLLAITDTSLATNPAARKVIGPIMRLAKETGIAVLLVHHTTKDGKVAGSAGVQQVLRLIYMVRWDKLNEGVVIVHKDKGNNIGKVADMRYEVKGTEQRPWMYWHTMTAAKPKASPQPQARPQNWRERQAGQQVPPAFQGRQFVGQAQGAPSARPRVATWSRT